MTLRIMLKLVLLFTISLFENVTSFPNERHIDDSQYLKKQVATSHDLFTSMNHMQFLINSNEEITNFIKEVTEYQKNQIYLAKLMLNDFELIKNASVFDPNRFISNPVNAFLLTKKLTKDFDAFINLVKSFWPKHLEEKLNKKIEESGIIMPTSQDYEGVIQGVHRLQTMYGLDVKEIRVGNLSRKYPVSRSLNAIECFEFGRIAYNQKDYKRSIKWMNEALDLAKLEGDKAEINEETVLDYLAFSVRQIGNIDAAIKLSKRLLEINPNNHRVAQNLIYYERDLKNQKVKLKTTLNESLKIDVTEDEGNDDEKAYKSLCRLENPEEQNSILSNKVKEIFLSAKNRSHKLKCQYITNNNPFLLIGPVKQEEIFDKPAIWIYYDVVTESQIKIMKDLALPKLKRAIVRNSQTGNLEPADYRISKSAWLTDDQDPQLDYLTNLVESITNLSLNPTAEEWQIGNYGIGGQYDPHYDYSHTNAFDESIGNRVATWLFYLEVPEKGGATVFPKVGASIQPVRRSAAFWYNMHANGDGDLLTRHAACPVLFGTKWVSNKWIHERGQEFKRPCPSINNHASA